MPHRALWLAALVGLGACGRTLPPDAGAAALYRDLQRLVSISAATGWKVDRVEVDKMLPDALMSLCRLQPDRRARLLAWIDKRIVALGGPVEQAYKKKGNRLDDLDALLELSRVRMLHVRALEAAPKDCPFWIEPKRRFAGRQVSDDRWLLSAGGGGQLIGLEQGGRFDVRFGGAGRLAFGRTFGSRWAALAGVELAGGAGFPPDDETGDRGELALNLDMAFPAMVRYRLVNAYIELEGGYLMHFVEGKAAMASGIHVGAAFAMRAQRTRWFFPGAAFGVSYQLVLPREELAEPLHMLKLGFRVAIDIDF